MAGATDAASAAAAAAVVDVGSHHSECVVAIVDLDVAMWRSRQLSVHDCLRSVVILLNAIRLANTENRVALFDGTGELLVKENEEVAEVLERELSRGHESHGKRAHLSAAMSKSLCFLNRFCVQEGRRLGVEPHARIVVVQVTPDDPSQYIASMNAAFAAQKRGIAVDVVDLSEKTSTILQQMAHLSGGMLQRFENLKMQELTQLLLSVFFSNKETRSLLRNPLQSPLVLEAACFCCGMLQSRAWVCSTCLSVFHLDPRTKSFYAPLLGMKGSQSVCPICKTKIAIN